MNSTLTLTQEWDKTFPQNEAVDHRKVTFHNRFGIELAADLYKPKGAQGPFAAQRRTIHARPRIFRSTSAAPFAFEKCLQSGENHASATGRPRQTVSGSTSQTDAW